MSSFPRSTASLEMKSPLPNLNPRGLTQLAPSGLQTAGRPAAGLRDDSVDYTRPPLSPRGTRRRGWGGNDGEPPGLQTAQLSAGHPHIGGELPAPRPPEPIRSFKTPLAGMPALQGAQRSLSEDPRLSGSRQSQPRGETATETGHRVPYKTEAPRSPRRNVRPERPAPNSPLLAAARPEPTTGATERAHLASAPDTARAPARSPAPSWGLSSPPCPAPPSPLSPDSGRPGPGHAHQRKPGCRTPRRPAPPVAPRAATQGSGQLSRETCRLVHRKEKGQG